MPPALSLPVALHSSLDNGHLVSRALNSTTDQFLIVCAWPVSGQYGPGARFLYYVLVAACVVGKRYTLLRSACLAAALLLPAVAAIHGIILACLHSSDAIDMDIYGAFQCCAIGILTAPPAVKFSATYWTQIQGRNIIFLWTGLVLSGLLSLTVEFYRSKAINDPQCASTFAYDGNEHCNLTCSPTAGPFSPMRGGAANNIYVIQAPTKLTFGMGTLFAAACCVPAVLQLISIWFKIAEERKKHGKQRFRNMSFGNIKLARQAPSSDDGTAEDAEVVTRVNDTIKVMLRVVEIPVFAAAVIAILIIGELNFWSRPVRYQQEPIAAVGQWSPIAATVLTLGTSIALYVASDKKETKNDTNDISSSGIIHFHDSFPPLNLHVEDIDEPKDNTCNYQFKHVLTPPPAVYNESIAPDDEPRSPSPQGQSPNRSLHPHSPLQAPAGVSSHSPVQPSDAGRGWLQRSLVNIFDNKDSLDDSQRAFRHAKNQLPRIPGEEHRNRDLRTQEVNYSNHRDPDGISRHSASELSAGGTTDDEDEISRIPGRTLSSPTSSNQHGTRASLNPPSSPPVLVGLGCGRGGESTRRISHEQRFGRPRNGTFPSMGSGGGNSGGGGANHRVSVEEARLSRNNTLDVPSTRR